MIFFNLGVIAIAIGFIGILITLKWDEWWDEWWQEAIGMFSCGFFSLGFIILICYEVNKDINPTAKDVYQSKTTLEITYKDGVAVDTVVVFKERK